MLKGPRGESINIHKDADQDRLRGERLNEIRKDMNNGDLSDREKLMRYSSHLDWFTTKWKALWSAMEFWQHPGKWDKDRYSHGFTNGLIAAFAIFVEEQADPPFKKTPEKYEASDDRILTDQAKGFMINISRQLECVICVDESGKPKGYGDHETMPEAWMQWRNDTIQHLEACPINIPEVQMICDRIKEFNDNLAEKEE